MFFKEINTFKTVSQIYKQYLPDYVE